MNIVPDWVLVALQTLPFLVAFLALRSILFQPMIAYLEERDAAIAGAKEETAKLRERIGTARAEWEQRLAEARAEGAAHRARIHADANVSRQELVNQARAETDREVNAELAAIAAARRAASAELERGAALLAHDIAERVLARPLARA